jgi:hypothetical protein
MVASPMVNNQNSQKGGGATMKQPNKFNSQLQQEILDSFQQLVKALIKTLLEALMIEERERGIST